VTDNPKPKFKLTGQQMLIAFFVVLALVFAGGNIIASLGTWSDNDANPAAETAKP
jgi:uncharacterized protein (DUF2062 family)